MEMVSSVRSRSRSMYMASSGIPRRRVAMARWNEGDGGERDEE
jgi:hypothetical protein